MYYFLKLQIFSFSSFPLNEVVFYSSFHFPRQEGVSTTDSCSLILLDELHHCMEHLMLTYYRNLFLGAIDRGEDHSQVFCASPDKTSVLKHHHHLFFFFLNFQSSHRQLRERYNFESCGFFGFFFIFCFVTGNLAQKKRKCVTSCNWFFLSKMVTEKSIHNFWRPTYPPVVIIMLVLCVCLDTTLQLLLKLYNLCVNWLYHSGIFICHVMWFTFKLQMSWNSFWHL